MRALLASVQYAVCVRVGANRARWYSFQWDRRISRGGDDDSDDSDDSDESDDSDDSDEKAQ